MCTTETGDKLDLKFLTLESSRIRWSQAMITTASASTLHRYTWTTLSEVQDPCRQTLPSRFINYHSRNDKQHR